jgi:hypothetical protein
VRVGLGCDEGEEAYFSLGRHGQIGHIMSGGRPLGAVGVIGSLESIL